MPEPTCTKHHRACACREANWAEVARQLDEARARVAELERAVAARNLYPISAVYDAYVAGALDARSCHPVSDDLILRSADGHVKTLQPRVRLYICRPAPRGHGRIRFTQPDDAPGAL